MMGDSNHHDRKDSKQQKMKRYKATFQRVTKLLFLASSIMLIAVAALRFTVIESQSAHESIMDVYFLFFGVVLAL